MNVEGIVKGARIRVFGAVMMKTGETKEDIKRESKNIFNLLSKLWRRKGIKLKTKVRYMLIMRSQSCCTGVKD